ncbi:serine hydrolase domain-containing protein [Streptomyces sp. NPDC005202]|uniref:serine hydrolase domain-containing protein n=1 Tax=Streptomyces sp. NPDC005202 TaxID=3157021 RepID=UPI0033A75292
MTRRKRPGAGVVGVAAAVAMAATALTGPAQAAARDRPAAAAAHQATQRAIDAAVAAGVPGVTIEVRDADGVWKSAAGVGDLKTGAPRGKNDRFRVTGITDTFVATVLLQMEAEKKLSLDDTVEHWLPGVVTGNGNDGSAITVRQLLNHTSGLFDYLADEEYGATYLKGDSYLQHRYDTVTPEQRLKVAFSHAPMFKPGAGHWFSNTNDVLAALIIEKAGGRSYEDEVRRRIIEPLGLRATSNPGTSARLPRPSSRGYSKLFSAQPDRIDDVTEVNGSQRGGQRRHHLQRGRPEPVLRGNHPRAAAATAASEGDGDDRRRPRLPGCDLRPEHRTAHAELRHQPVVSRRRHGGVDLLVRHDRGRPAPAHLQLQRRLGGGDMLPILDAEFCDTPSGSR